MKHFALSILLILLFSHCLQGQNISFDPIKANPFELIRTDIDSAKFYQALQKLRIVEKNYQDNYPNQATYYQALATIFSFNLMQDSAICAYNKSQTRGIIKNRETNDTLSLANYHTYPADRYIINKADSFQVIMINESHHTSSHRLFTKSLLKDLYEKGYRVLCLETMHYDFSRNWNTAAWNGGLSDQSSLIALEGYYSKEICFAEMIREALRLGYIIYGYEPNKEQTGERDSMMAENINEIFEFHPKTKIIVHVGYGHNSTTSPKSLYNYLSQINKNLNILSVNQTLYSSQTTSLYEREAYRVFKKTFSCEKPVVLLDESDILFQGKGADVYVFSPPASYKNNRPSWLYEQGKRQAVSIGKIKKNSIIKAYYVYEREKKQKIKYKHLFYLPVDMLVLENVDVPKEQDLVLPKGIFIIEYSTLDGTVYKKHYLKVR